MNPWYVRPGALRGALAVVALYIAITSLIRILTERGTSDAIFNVLGVVIGVAALVAVVLSMRFDRRSRDTNRPGSSDPP